MKRYKIIILLLLSVTLISCKHKNKDESALIQKEQIQNPDGAEEIQAGYESMQLSKDILIDQIGYKKSSKKIVIFRESAVGDSFSVVNAENKKVVYQGRIRDKRYNPSAKENNAYGYFNEIEQEGTYFIVVDNKYQSDSFEIKENLYRETLLKLMNELYLQRCGIELKSGDEKLRGACHEEQSELIDTGVALDVKGGWHDSLDEGRYVVNGAQAAANLLLAYSYQPNIFEEDSETSVSSNKIPNILDEVKYEMDWLLKMQESTGGVYHKVAYEENIGKLVISPVSTSATANFAGVMAMFSEIYRPFNNAYANQCVAAAESAWNYLEANTDNEGFKNPKGVTSKEYADNYDIDERYFAAAQLYKLTGSVKYHQYIKNTIGTEIPTGFKWNNVGYFGSLAYLTTNFRTDMETCNIIMNQLMDEVMSVATATKENGYLISIDNEDSVENIENIFNNTMLLSAINKLSQSREYEEIIENHIHYLAGRNPYNKSYMLEEGRGLNNNVIKQKEIYQIGQLIFLLSGLW